MALRSTFMLVSLAACALAGCGGGDPAPRATTTTQGAQAAARPALARAPAKPGELVFAGEASPATRGPIALDGRYLVRFEQVAPEDPHKDFSAQTPFTAALERRAGDPRGAVKLFGAAARSGRRVLTLHGRYALDVSFGDFPYAVRFTPRR
jgi:hypothetical protein